MCSSQIMDGSSCDLVFFPSLEFLKVEKVIRKLLFVSIDDTDVPSYKEASSRRWSGSCYHHCEDWSIPSYLVDLMGVILAHSDA